ncbi:AAA family ATPase, partial [Rhodoflexus sp.]
MIQKYPIGIQDFRKLREEGYVYIDKTQHIHRLITQGSYYFLSRPRRFGKSLLLSTMKEIFLGNQELFKGLWIEDQIDWQRTSPVIHLSFAQLTYQTDNLALRLRQELQRLADAF